MMRPGLLETARDQLREVRAQWPDAVHIVSVSGGKDSTATYLLAQELLGDAFEGTFADTGHELPSTYAFVRELHERTGGPEVRWVQADFSKRFAKRRGKMRRDWVKEGVPIPIIKRAMANMKPSGNPYLDLCLLRNGFPSPKRKFCTDELKLQPIQDRVYWPLTLQGRPIVSWVGVRRDESDARANLTPTGPLINERYASKRVAKKIRGCVFRPILDWSVLDVWDMHEANRLEPNGLYRMGASRVGCAPCIHARLDEIRLFSREFPEWIDRLEDWEGRVALVTKRDPPVATFFHARDIQKFIGGPITTETHGIRAMVRYANSRKHKPSETTQSLFDPTTEIFGRCDFVGMCE